MQPKRAHYCLYHNVYCTSIMGIVLWLSLLIWFYWTWLQHQRVGQSQQAETAASGIAFQYSRSLHILQSRRQNWFFTLRRNFLCPGSVQAVCRWTHTDMRVLWNGLAHLEFLSVARWKRLVTNRARVVRWNTFSTNYPNYGLSLSSAWRRIYVYLNYD